MTNPTTPGKYLVTYSWFNRMSGRTFNPTEVIEWTGGKWRLFSGAVVTKWSELP